MSRHKKFRFSLYEHLGIQKCHFLFVAGFLAMVYFALKRKPTLGEKMKNLISLMVFAITTTLSGAALAATQQYSLNSMTGWFSAGQRATHNFQKPTYVEKVHIDAIGSRNFQDAQVYADGEFVANLGVPGVDPYYPVIVRKKVQSLMIVFRGSIQIQNFSIEVNETPFQRGLRSDDDSTPAGLADSVLTVIAALQETASPQIFQQYLLPLRQMAIQMSASGRGRPDRSTRTLTRVRSMISAINNAEDFLIKDLAHSNYYVESIQTLMFVKERLQSMYEL